jgi:crotonobetainyl-CoA:carnitine CoA-transferase CaiB-like acyl-CoA transferase
MRRTATNQSTGWLATGESRDVSATRTRASSRLRRSVEVEGVRTVAFPAVLSETPASATRRPPELDEHGAEIRSSLSRD